MRFYTDISRLLPTSSISKYAPYQRAPNRPAILTLSETSRAGSSIHDGKVGYRGGCMIKMTRSVFVKPAGTSTRN